MSTSLKHAVTLEHARKLTSALRARKDDLVKDEYKGKHIIPVCETFEREAIDKLLAYAGCTGIRLYYGLGDDDRLHAIIVGVDSEGKDLLPTATKNPQDGVMQPASDTEPVIVEDGLPCPPSCPTGSPLNG
jgi:hypothetical protein